MVVVSGYRRNAGRGRSYSGMERSGTGRCWLPPPPPTTPPYQWASLSAMVPIHESRAGLDEQPRIQRSPYILYGDTPSEQPAAAMSYCMRHWAWTQWWTQDRARSRIERSWREGNVLIRYWLPGLPDTGT